MVFKNPNLPKPVKSVKLYYGGNGEIFVSVDDADNPDYTHYLAEIVATDGTVLENNIGKFGRGSSFTFGKEALLSPGKEYNVKVKTLREDYKQSSEGEYKTFYYYGSTVEEADDPIVMPDTDMPELESIQVNFPTDAENINTNVKDVVIKYTFKNDVFVEPNVNGSKYYVFDYDTNPKAEGFSYFKKEWTFALDDLDDGDYVVDFTAYRPNKDHIIGSKTDFDNAYFAFTIDSSAPVLSLAQGDAEKDDGTVLIFGTNTVFTDDAGNYSIEGMTETTATLTLDGEKDVTVGNGGTFKIKKAIADNEAYKTHTIQAVDKAGNVSSITFSAVRSGAFTFNGISLLSDGKEIAPDKNGEKRITLKNGDKANLTVYANAQNGKNILLTMI